MDCTGRIFCFIMNRITKTASVRWDTASMKSRGRRFFLCGQSHPFWRGAGAGSGSSVWRAVPFALDVRCHGLIGEKMVQSGLSHAEVEVELDRALLTRDGFAPASAHLVGHIVPSHRNAAVIEKFYPGVSAAEGWKRPCGVCVLQRIAARASPLKRQALFAALRLAGCYRDIHGMVVRTAADPRCADSTAKLLTLYEQGETLALRLIGEYEAYLAGKAPLDEMLRWNFESRMP